MRETLEYQILLENLYVKALSMGVSNSELEKLLNRVIQRYPETQPLGHLRETERRLPFVAMGLPETEEERILKKMMAPSQWDEFPKSGEIVLLRIRGLVGWLVWALQALNGDLSRWTHVGVMLTDHTIFEAQPGGAVISPWVKYEGRPWAVVKHKQVPATHDGATPNRWGLEPLKLAEEDRIRLDLVARHFEGTPYNWGTYFYLAAYRVGIRPEWLKQRVQNPDRLICSQAADEIYALSGIHLFCDGRMPCDVSPGDLARLA